MRSCAFRLRLHRSAGFVLSLSTEGQAAEARRIRPPGTGTMQKKTWLDAIRTRIRNSSRRRRSSRPVAAQLESMEDRTLLSVTSFFVGGKLVVRSTGADNDSIVVQTNPQSNTLVQVLANGSPIAAVSTLPASLVTEIEVTGSDGANSLSVAGVSAAGFPNLTSVRVDGGQGDDVAVKGRAAIAQGM